MLKKSLWENEQLWHQWNHNENQKYASEKENIKSYQYLKTCHINHDALKWLNKFLQWQKIQRKYFFSKMLKIHAEKITF